MNVVVVTAWKYPIGCDSSGCEYEAQWWFDEKTDYINFTIKARQPVTHWTAIAFVPQPKMVIKSVVAFSDIY